MGQPIFHSLVARANASQEGQCFGWLSSRQSRWAPDGTLLAAGQGGTAPSQTSNVVKVNPTTLKVQELIRHPDIDGFGVSTVAIQVANELWLGSVRGDRIAIFPLVQSQPSR